MFRNTLDRKPFVTKRDGETIRDLTDSIFDFRSNNYEKFIAYRVPTDFAMRPDLISQAVYNNTVYTEYILKYNGISNPFSISPDDMILIPDLDTAQMNTKKRTNDAVGPKENRLRNYYKYIDPTKVPEPDQQLMAFDRRNIGQRLGKDTKEGALPPNIAREGQEQIVERNGRIFFGEGVGRSAAIENQGISGTAGARTGAAGPGDISGDPRSKKCLKNGMSSSEFLSKVVRSRRI